MGSTADIADIIFRKARAMPSDERSAYLDEACAGNAALRVEVEALLAAEPSSGSASRADEVDSEATIAARQPATQTHPVEQVGQMIERYKLLEQIGEGGFGTVWAAEQREPVKRRVALKIIKLGMDTQQVIARFEAERQALAMMDHPNIAKVFDAGMTETGRPYFVMEYIRGVPIIDYCDTEKLDTKARLSLFMAVCHAIQHAHQKGIIHRDIKPGNVLVTLHDGVPVAKVIDFGIAKAINQELTQKTLYTQHHQMIGTPAYMSPEQAEMSGLDVDTRADIYSLGVLLYELLTGTTPFDSHSLVQAGLGEMMRIIREETPHKPSTRLSSLGKTGVRTAECHRTDLKRLGLILRGDLDWIVMRCLEKDRTRRYETANGLAADILRHLSDEPVVAGPPSQTYKLRKFVKRNRTQVMTASALAALLFLGIVGTSTGLSRALQEKTRADLQAERANQQAERANGEAARANESAAAEVEARRVAEANEVRAREEANRSNEIKRLITNMLQGITPEQARGADITLLKSILDNTAERLKKGEIADDLIAAELHSVIGLVYERIGLYPEAEEHLPIAVTIRERVLGEEHPNTLNAINDLAILYREQGQYPKAEALFLETLDAQNRLRGAGHVDTLNARNNLANLYRDQGRFTEAEPLYLDTLAIQRRSLGDEHPLTLNAMNNLANVYADQGRLAEAEPLYRESLKIRRRVLGEEHPQTLNSMNNLAVLFMEQTRFAEAEPLYLETLDARHRVLGEAHPSTLASMNNLANVYMAQNRPDEAEPLYLQTLETRRRVLGEAHPHALGSMNNLANLYAEQGRYDEAVPLYLETLEIQRRVLGSEHPETLTSMYNLALLHTNQGQHIEAEAFYRELLNAQILGAEHPNADAATLNEAAWALLTFAIEAVRDPSRALDYAQRACTLAEAAGNDRLWAYLDTLALAQHRTGDSETAIETQRRAIDLVPEGQDTTQLEQTLAEYQTAMESNATP